MAMVAPLGWTVLSRAALLWHNGDDTAEIAAALRVSEATIYRDLDMIKQVARRITW